MTSSVDPRRRARLSTGRRRFVVSPLSLALLGLALAPAAWPCGPVFPTTLLAEDGILLETPASPFLAEVQRLDQLPEPQFAAVEASYPAHFTAATGRDQLVGALGLDPHRDRKDPRLVAYEALRREISIYQEALEDWRYSLHWSGSDHDPRPELLQVEVPGGLPREFELYLRGAVAYHHQDAETARREWTELLSLPADQRRLRTVWAEYMLARIDFESAEAAVNARHTPDVPEPQDREAEARQRAHDEAALRSATERFRRTRELVAEGLPDPLGLAEESLGWEARGEWRLGGWGRAIELYGQQVAGGDRGAGASLHEVCRRAVLAGDGALAKVAASPFAREVMTLYLASHRDGRGREVEVEVAKSWAERLEDHGVETVATAGLVAWVAYQAARFEEADRWAAMARPSDARARWVRAKLRLREGRLAEAEVLLEGLAGETFGPRAEGEAGAVAVALGDYTRAVDRLLRSGYITDASYVAERLMTVEELRTYVDAQWPHELPDESPYWSTASGIHRPTDGWIAWRIRHLLARRLARGGRWTEAAGYYPGTRLPAAARQVAGWLACGDDPDCPAERRAEALWQAAKTLRSQGLELVGAALAPDYQLWGAAYGGGDDSPWRAGFTTLPAGPEEIERWRRSAVEPPHRYHYRFVAADLAWRAAELMPDDDVDTAWVLTVAGSWIKYLEPAEADRFYKALVRRCGSTELGREAARRRWFPPV